MNKPTDSVRIIIQDKDRIDYFLLLTEIDDPQNFKLPGGKFENEQETPEEAACRELLEELGIDAEKIGLKMVNELLNDDGISKRYIFFANVDVLNIKPSDEIAQTLWVRKDNIPEGKNKGHILAAISSLG